jgi:putative ABC transport system ATP-binding protein
VHAADEVDIALQAGRIVGLIGRSGSGKTTILNLIAGWERPDSGEINWKDGYSRNRPPNWRSLAVVPQHLGLLDELSVQRNIELPALLANRNLELHDRVRSLVEALGLAELRNRGPHEISLGQQQRVAVGRAVVLEPQVLIADEPTAHLDDVWAARVFELLRELVNTGASCLIATHNEALIRHVDEVIMLKDGRVASRSKPGP